MSTKEEGRSRGQSSTGVAGEAEEADSPMGKRHGGGRVPSHPSAVGQAWGEKAVRHSCSCCLTFLCAGEDVQVGVLGEHHDGVCGKEEKERRRALDPGLHFLVWSPLLATVKRTGQLISEEPQLERDGLQVAQILAGCPDHNGQGAGVGPAGRSLRLQIVARRRKGKKRNSKTRSYARPPKALSRWHRLSPASDQPASSSACKSSPDQSWHLPS